MHPLLAWMNEHGVSQAAFAEFIGTSQGYLSDICSGRRFPSRKLARVIEIETHGEVRAADLLLFERAA